MIAFVSNPGSTGEIDVMSADGTARAGGHGASQAQDGAMFDCPWLGEWTMAVWHGPDNTDVGQAVETCGEGRIAAAYRIDPETQAWEHWFADWPEASNLLRLDNGQAVLVLGNPSWFPPTSEVFRGVLERTQLAYQRIIEGTPFEYEDPDGGFSMKYMSEATLFDVYTGATSWEEYEERWRRAAQFFSDRGIDYCRININFGADPVLSEIPMPPDLDLPSEACPE